MGMADGLLSIKDRRKTDHLNPEVDSATHNKPKPSNTTFNPYRYVSPNLFNSSNVNYLFFVLMLFL